MKKALFFLLLGAGGGAAGMFYGQAPVEEALGVSAREVEGVVVEETRDEESGRLVVILNADSERVLAVFESRADDVAALVGVGDRMTLRAGPDGVFADDPEILHVRRAGEGSTASSDLETEDDGVDAEGEGDAEEAASEESTPEGEEGADDAAADEDSAQETTAESTGEGEPQARAPTADATPGEPT